MCSPWPQLPENREFDGQGANRSNCAGFLGADTMPTFCPTCQRCSWRLQVWRFGLLLFRLRRLCRVWPVCTSAVPSMPPMAPPAAWEAWPRRLRDCPASSITSDDPDRPAEHRRQQGSVTAPDWRRRFREIEGDKAGHFDSPQLPMLPRSGVRNLGVKASQMADAGPAAATVEDFRYVAAPSTAQDGFIPVRLGPASSLRRTGRRPARNPWPAPSAPATRSSAVPAVTLAPGSMNAATSIFGLPHQAEAGGPAPSAKLGQSRGEAALVMLRDFPLYDLSFSVDRLGGRSLRPGRFNLGLRPGNLGKSQRSDGLWCRRNGGHRSAQ
jgi:hypothetical protein